MKYIQKQMGKKMNMKFIELNSIGTLQGDNRTGNDTLLELYVFNFLYINVLGRSLNQPPE
ncbi:hypothetical protein MED222_13230 [Vibrio sp. MED222]|nr:hypothetical protein MED222_13230 [Vibrio sp. MED222]